MQKLPIFLLILGFIYRMIIIKIFPQPFIWDQLEYHRYALGMLNNGIYAETARTYGFPLILVVFYKIFGIGNIVYFHIFQAFLDSLTGLFVFFIARNIFRKQSIPLFAMFLYMLNPFTSAYTGVVLSEISAVFLLTLFLFLTLLYLKSGGKLFLPALTLLLGFLPQVRTSFLIFSLITLAVLIFGLLKDSVTRGILHSIVLVSFFFIPFIYPIIGNMKFFGEFNPSLVDNVFVRELYISLFADKLPVYGRPDPYPFEVGTLYNEYSKLPRNREERRQMSAKYFSRSIAIIRNDPAEFLVSRFRNMLRTWDKYQIFFYFYTSRSTTNFIYWINLFLLTVSVTGLFNWMRLIIPAGDKGYIKKFGMLLSFLITYMTLLHAFSTTEGRYTLPLYPMVFLFASYAIFSIPAGLSLARKKLLANEQKEGNPISK